MRRAMRRRSPPPAAGPAPAPDVASARHVLLLRAINVGQRQLPMAALRELAQSFGWRQPRTHLASGNLVVGLPEAPPQAARRLEAAVLEHFGFHSDVIVRSAAQWPVYLARNPLAEAAEAEPNRVMLLLANQAPAADALARLRERAAPGERIEAADDALWFHFAAGAGSSKLTPSFIDRCVGAPATSRNWRTVQALQALLADDA